MDTLQLVLSLLKNLALVTKDPALQARDQAVTSLLTIVTLAEHGVEGVKQLKVLHDQVQKMVDEKRAPTDDEWAALKARSDKAHAEIQAFDPGTVPE